MDEDGLLYAVNSKHLDERERIIKIYDWDGNCIEEHTLDITMGKPTDLIVGEHYIYLLGPEADCEYVLYQIDKTTWEAKRLYDFTEFKDIFSTANHTLGVYGYTEDRGYVIMEYVPETGEVKEVVQKDGANDCGCRVVCVKSIGTG